MRTLVRSRPRAGAPAERTASPPAEAGALAQAALLDAEGVLAELKTGLAFVGRMPQLSVAIIAVIVLNGLFSFAQE